MKKIISIIAVLLIITSCSGKSNIEKNATTNNVEETESEKNYSKPISISETGVLDTVVTISVYDSTDTRVLKGAVQVCKDLERKISRTIPTSEISQINSAKGEWVTVSDDTVELLEKGIEYGNLSKGKFDITIGGLSQLWNFNSKHGIPPEEDLIEEALEYVEFRNIEINGNDVRLLNENSIIEPGGIGKGFIADKVKEYLLEEGITSAIINLGGNVVLVGNKPGNKDFSVGLRKPFEDVDVYMGIIEASDKSIVSSGVYEKYFEYDGEIYHHILDLETGYPLKTNLYAVTIISEYSVDGDGLSTTVFALGEEEGLKLIESLEDTEAIFIKNDYSIVKSSGIGTDVVFREVGN